jgi:hypothetical protein
VGPKLLFLDPDPALALSPDPGKNPGALKKDIGIFPQICPLVLRYINFGYQKQCY